MLTSAIHHPWYSRADHRPVQRLICVAITATLWSAFHPKDWGVWAFELALGWVAVALLLLTYRRCRFSGLLYDLAALHLVVLAVGARYTYAEVPLFEWLKGPFGWERNHFDRLGHFFQGLVPALAVFELLRRGGLRSAVLLPLATGFACLGFSALYEILEWQMVVWLYPGQGPEWLGMQGDPWDTQADMLMCLLGAATSLVLLRPFHRRAIERLEQA